MKNYSDAYISSNIELTQKAYRYCLDDFSHEELIKELLSDDEIKKQLCIINLKKITSQKEAEALIYNLTGKGGPIREVTSIKIHELINNPDLYIYFQSENFIDTFVKAITDVNPTVCRNIIDCLEKIENKKYLKQKLFEKIFTILDELKEFKQIKSHLLNKKTFNLYWCLEALMKILPFITCDKAFDTILSLSSEFNDYTIREKTAKILSMIKDKNSTIEELTEKLKNDENIYVRRYFTQTCYT